MHRTRNAVLLVIAAMLAAACGARLSDEQVASLASNQSEFSARGTAGDGSTDGASGSTTTVAAGSGGSQSGAQGGGAAAGGDADGQGGGGGGGIGVGGSTCGGGGASEVGVTETEIRIGNVSTITGAVENFGRTGQNAAKAYANFVNANGGVCGRQLVIATADDALQSGRNKSETDRLSKEVMAFAGGVTVVDDGSAQSLKGTNIVDSSIAITDAKIQLPNHFPVVPINLSSGGNNSVPILQYMKSQLGVKTAVLVYPEQAAAAARMSGYETDLAKVGIQVVAKEAVAIVGPNFSTVVEKIRSNKVDMVLTTLEVTGMASLARELYRTNGNKVDANYYPKVPFYGAQAFGDDFIAQASPAAADPTILGLAYSIPADAGAVPAMNEMVTWYQRTNPGAPLDYFAIQSWAAVDLIVTALRSIDGEPTRDKLLAVLQGVTEFDAGGILAPMNPAGKVGPTCFMIAEVQGGQWVRTHPAGGGYECGYA